MQAILATTRQKTLAALVKALGDYGGNTMVHLWERQAMRLYMGKPPLPEFARLPCAKGKYSGTWPPRGPTHPRAFGPTGPQTGATGPRPSRAPPRVRARAVSVAANRCIARPAPGTSGPRGPQAGAPGPRPQPGVTWAKGKVSVC